MNTTITVDLPTKTATYSGDMCIRDMVAVVVSGASQADAAGLVLRILRPDDHAEMAVCDSFSADGATFVGDLDLSGTDLIAEFENDPSRKFRAFMIQVFNKASGNASLLINERVFIMQNVFTDAMISQVLTEA